MTDPTPDKLAEAKKLLEIWNIEKSDTMGGYVYINPIHVAHTDALLAAASLLAASEQRKRDAEIVDKANAFFISKEHSFENGIDPYSGWVPLEIIEEKMTQIHKEILNQDSQQNISSNQK